MLYLDDDKLEKFQIYCDKTGRKLSPLIVRALDEYIMKNPLK